MIPWDLCEIIFTRNLTGFFHYKQYLQTFCCMELILKNTCWADDEYDYDKWPVPRVRIGPMKSWIGMPVSTGGQWFKSDIHML